jgi:hypothetical protein
MGSSSGQVKPKTIKLVFALSPLNTQLLWERAKTSCLEIRIICLIGATDLLVNCCFSGLPQKELKETCWSSTKWTSSSYWNVTCSHHDIADGKYTLGIKQQSLNQSLLSPQHYLIIVFTWNRWAHYDHAW